jgi:hypothetical protein
MSQARNYANYEACRGDENVQLPGEFSHKVLKNRVRDAKKARGPYRSYRANHESPRNDGIDYSSYERSPKRSPIGVFDRTDPKESESGDESESEANYDSSNYLPGHLASYLF